MITYQFRIYPSKSQKTEINRQLEVHRELYNRCLEIKIKTCEDTEKSPSCFDLIKSEVPEFKGKTNYSSLQQTVRRLEKSYNAFFKKNSKFPRFKSKNRFRTIEYGKYGDGCKIRKSNMYFQFVGEVKVKFHREIKHEIKTISLTKNGNEYYVNIICSKEKPINDYGTKFIGIDFGIKTTINMSDGKSTKSPYFSKPKNKSIKRLHRRKNYKALGKVHRKIANQRKDFNHKLSKKIVDNNDIICLEDLKVESIKSEEYYKKPINKKLYDIGINQLINFIKYKAENAGKYVVMVNPAYTTQTCYNCGKKQKLKLSQRQYNCNCGYQEDRDTNAAKNILRLGLKSLGFNPRSLGIYSGE